MKDLARRIEDLDAPWLTGVLRAAGMPAVEVEHVDATAIGTGQLGSVFRLTPRYRVSDPAAPRTLIAKLASTDDASRAQGMALGVYETEVRFYDEIAPMVAMRVPEVWLAVVDPASGWFTLLFEDLAERAEVGDVVAGGTVDQASLALEALVGLQAPLWDAPTLGARTWLADPEATIALFASFADQVDPFLDRFGHRLDAEHVSLIERVVPRAGGWVQTWTGPRVVQHGDFRLDNMLFGTAAGAPPVTVVDWQTARLGPPLLDVGYYLGACLTPDDRRAHEDALLAEYHRGLVAAGVESFALADCQADLRRACLYGLFLAVGMGVRVRQTERGDEMFAVATRQYADMALERDAAGTFA